MEKHSNFDNRKNQALDPSWDHVRQKYRIYNKIGQGSYGEVVRAKNIKTALKVAIKKQKISCKRLYDLRKLLTELQILRQLSQYMSQSETNCFSGVPQLLDVMQNQDYIFIVTEFMESDLKQVLDTSEKINFGYDQMILIFYNILKVVNCLHSANIMHRDIKPSNILVNEKFQVKICDFGISRNIRKNAPSKLNFQPKNFSTSTAFENSPQNNDNLKNQP